MELAKRLLLEVFKCGSLTRKELSERLDVAKSTLSLVITRLRRDGLISVQSRIKGRGRPEEVISLSSKAWKSVGIKIGREAVIGVVMNGDLEEEKKVIREVRKEDREEEGYSKLLVNVMDELGASDAVAVGLSVSGIVENGMVLDSPMLNLKMVDFKDVLSKYTAVFVVMSDVQSLAIYEKMKFGGDRFLVVNYGLGIGACLYCEDRTFILPIGHIVVKPDGEKCYCGKRGCLETVASDYSNLKSFTGGDFSISDFVEYEHERYSKKLQQLWKLARENPGLVEKHYEKSLEYLSLVLGNIAQLVKMEKISIYGEGAVEWFVEKLERKMMETFGEIPKLLYRGDETDAFEKGAAYRAVIEAIKRGGIL